MKKILVFIFLFLSLQVAAEKPSLLIISFTSFNKDFLTSYGGKESSMPFFDELAKNSLLFENALNQSSWRNITGVLTPVGDQKIMKKNGYHAIGYKVTKFSPIAWEKIKRLGVQEAPFKIKFHRYEDHKDIWKTLKTKFKKPIKKPFFTQIHLKTNHIPYINTSKWEKLPAELRAYLSQTKDYKKRIPFLLSLLDEEIVYPLLGWKLEKVINNAGFREISKQTYLSIHKEKYLNQWKESPYYKRDLELLKKYYSKTLKTTDAIVSRFLNEVLHYKKQKNLILILMGAHGESFMEHGRLSHGEGVSDTEIKIPLIIHYPKEIKKQIIHKKQFNDSSLGKLALEVIKNKDRKINLYEKVKAVSVKDKALFISNCGGNLFALRVNNKWKMTYDLYNDHFELFDIQKDPEEKNPLKPGQESESYLKMKALLMEKQLHISGKRKVRKILTDSYCPVRL